MHPSVRLVLVLLLLSIAFSSSAQQQPQPPPAIAGMPSADQTLAYLRETIEWHELLHQEEQLANRPEESAFLSDERTVAKEILQLSFSYANAAAKLLSRKASPSSTEETPNVSGYSGLSKAAAQTDKVVRDTQAELEETKRKAESAQGQKRRQLQSTADELQSELNLAKARSDTYKNILRFVGTGTGSSLDSQITELE